MPDCPSTDLLDQMLTGELDGTVLSGVREHINHCPECRGYLDRASDDAQLQVYKASRTTRPATQDRELKAVLHRLKDSSELAELLARISKKSP